MIRDKNSRFMRKLEKAQKKASKRYIKENDKWGRASFKYDKRRIEVISFNGG